MLKRQGILNYCSRIDSVIKLKLPTAEQEIDEHENETRSASFSKLTQSLTRLGNSAQSSMTKKKKN